MAAAYRFDRSFASRAALAAMLALSLAACGSSEESDAGGDDSALLDDAQDPAMTGALEDQILVDPDLVDQSNGNAVLGNGDDGAVPSASLPKGAAARGSAAAKAEFQRRGMLSAPEPTVASAEDCENCGGEAVTLGAMAEKQKRGGACTDKLEYAMGWADRMPAAFTVYPGANLKEAAGAQTGSCSIRAASFTTGVGIKDVVDYYYTKARRAGFTAEYQLRDGEHVLGGVKDSTDGAYVIFLRPMPNGGTEADIIANNGR